MRPTIIAPSLLAADFTKLGDEVRMVNDSEADWFHLDVMDGRFVPNISYGMSIIASIKKIAAKPFDVHLMIVEPEKYIEQFRAAGADSIIVHYEACIHLHRALEQIKSTGARAGVALNPHTPVALLEDILEMTDQVLLMSVNPGFGGQKFIYHTIPKIRRLRAMIDERNLPTLIEVDGGIGLQNAAAILSAGADALVTGSTIFGSDDPKKTIALLKNILNDHQI